MTKTVRPDNYRKSFYITGEAKVVAALDFFNFL